MTVDYREQVGLAAHRLVEHFGAESQTAAGHERGHANKQEQPTTVRADGLGRRRGLLENFQTLRMLPALEAFTQPRGRKLLRRGAQLFSYALSFRIERIKFPERGHCGGIESGGAFAFLGAVLRTGG